MVPRVCPRVPWCRLLRNHLPRSRAAASYVVGHSLRPAAIVCLPPRRTVTCRARHAAALLRAVAHMPPRVMVLPVVDHSCAARRHCVPAAHGPCHRAESVAVARAIASHPPTRSPRLGRARPSAATAREKREREPESVADAGAAAQGAAQQQPSGGGEGSGKLAARWHDAERE